jgi:hypothetical protein
MTVTDKQTYRRCLFVYQMNAQAFVTVRAINSRVIRQVDENHRIIRIIVVKCNIIGRVLFQY